MSISIQKILKKLDKNNSPTKYEKLPGNPEQFRNTTLHERKNQDDEPQKQANQPAKTIE